FNKIDQPEAQQRWPQVKAELEKRGYQPVAISALARTELQPLLWRAWELLKEAPLPEPEAELPVYKPEEDARTFTIEREAGGWRVRGAAIERSAAMTYWEYEGSVRRFQRLMETLGVEKALRQAGIEEGETVFIGEYELEWSD
ncbi:MAG: Obg family GTPase CgtA, partial [Chloroflexi bacterium]|nr:Obg family GTPase CgtA [Chloroflexota bacterium]